MEVMTRIPPREVAAFTRLFATLIGAGLPLVHSLDVLARQTSNRRLRRVLRDIIADVEAGGTLAGAMSRHPRAFSELSVGMVAAGEAAGALDTILRRLSDFLEKSASLSRRLRAALIYPAAIAAISIPAVGVLLAFVIPTFESMFASAGVPLPLPTRAVIAASDALTRHWWAFAAAAVAAGAAARRGLRTDGGRLLLDRAVLALPGLGGLARKLGAARFARTLATLSASGVSILEGLEVTARTAGNQVIGNAVLRARASIAAGATISAPLEESGAFPPMAARMMEVGEQTGALDEMLERIADHYDEEVDAALDALVGLVEPAVIVVLGVVVGGVVVAMYLPVFDMIGIVG